MRDDDDLDRAEIEALLATRRELGATYDAELVTAFAERIERTVESRLGTQPGNPSRLDRLDRMHESAGKRQLALGIVSVVAGIPTTALTLAVPEGGTASMASMAIGWLGIGAVNAAHALQSRRR